MRHTNGWFHAGLIGSAIVLGVTPAFAADPAPMAPTGTATISGKVTYKNPPPQLPKLRMDADPVCSQQHSTAAVAQHLVVNEANKGVQYAFVFVVSGLPAGEYPAPKTAAVFDQKGCVYEPHVLGVQANQPVEIRNSDGTLHNVNAKPTRSTPFNLAMPTQGMKINKTFTAQEIMVPVKCNVHPWMQSYIGVVNHPYFAVSGSDGSFSIKGLPAGTYTVQMWHETLGTKTETVELADGGSKNIAFEF